MGTEACFLIWSWQSFGNAVYRLAHRITFLWFCFLVLPPGTKDWRRSKQVKCLKFAYVYIYCSSFQGLKKRWLRKLCSCVLCSSLPGWNCLCGLFFWEILKKFSTGWRSWKLLWMHAVGWQMHPSQLVVASGIMLVEVVIAISPALICQ